MPVIGKSFRATKKLFMPSTEGAKKEDEGWIVIHKDIKVGQIMDLLKRGETVDKSDKNGLRTYLVEMIKLYKDLIIDWNYEDKKGNKVEINDVNIAMALSQRDLFYIESQLQGEAEKAKLTTTEKKN